MRARGEPQGQLAHPFCSQASFCELCSLCALSPACLEFQGARISQLLLHKHRHNAVAYNNPRLLG